MSRTKGSKNKTLEQIDQEKNRVKIGHRPTILNEELINSICEAISNGLFIVRACEKCGIRADRYYEWLSKATEDNEKQKKSGEPDTIYQTFSDRVKKEEALLQEKKIEEANQLARDECKTWPEPWRFLGSRFRQEWSQYESKQIEHVGAGGGPIQIFSKENVKAEKAP